MLTILIAATLSPDFDMITRVDRLEDRTMAVESRLDQIDAELDEIKELLSSPASKKSPECTCERCPCINCKCTKLVKAPEFVPAPGQLPVLYTTDYCQFCPAFKQALDMYGIMYVEQDGSHLGSVPQLHYQGQVVEGFDMEAALRMLGKQSVQAAGDDYQQPTYVEPAYQSYQQYAAPQRRGVFGRLFGKRRCVNGNCR